MTAIRKTPRANYSQQEKRVLLTGVPVSIASTPRLGHPKSGWNIKAVREAWNDLKVELLIEWDGSDFEYHRRQHDRPFAERQLSQIEGGDE